MLRSIVQLPCYLERVVAGGRDLALVLLPLLNDLRAVRGSPLLSEGTLLLLNLKSDWQATPVAPTPGEQPLTIEQWARRLRARFQVGLIGWIRGERIDQNLEILAAVAHKIEQVATRQPVFQLWWVTGALIEALRERGLEGGVSIKRLLGLADREVKRLYEEGEARYCQGPPVELLNNLLYYIARAESSGPKVSAVRASFRLGDLLPVDEAVEQERESLSAPSVKLMRTVAAAIREDLAKVKDVLDIFVRRGGGQTAELGPQAELLRKIGDTLGVLLDLHLPDSHGLMGLAELRAEHPAVAVVMISANEDPAVIRRALAFGAAGYIPKGASLDELAGALRAVLNCEEYVPPQLRNAIGATTTNSEDLKISARLASLTPQQFRVLSLVADGQLNKQFADKLGIQERTIKAHLSLIFQKLGVRNRTQASVMLRSLELGDPAKLVELAGDGEG